MVVDIPVNHQVETYFNEHVEQKEEVLKEIAMELQIKMQKFSSTSEPTEKENKWVKWAKEYSQIDDVEGIGEIIRENNKEFREGFSF